MLSVCMSTYNGEAFVIRQIESILSQLQADDELIIIDDCSGDKTVSLINALADDRIRLYQNTRNLGPSQNFAKALGFSKGEILFLADQDDIWLPTKVSEVLYHFKKTDAQLLVHDAQVVDQDLAELSPSWNQFNHNNTQPTVCSTILKNSFTGCMMAFKRELLPIFLPVPAQAEMHDQWFGLAALRNKKKVVFLDQPLMLYVRHGGNVTAIHKRSLTTKLKGRLKTIQALIQFKK